MTPIMLLPWQQLCRWYCFNYDKKFPGFILNKDHPLPPIWEELGQYGNHAYPEQDPLAHFKRLQMGIFGFSQKETGAKSVAMATTQ